MRKKRCDKRDKQGWPECKREFWTNKKGPVLCWKHKKALIDKAVRGQWEP
jgi:hypothetical protein